MVVFSLLLGVEFLVKERTMKDYQELAKKLIKQATERTEDFVLGEIYSKIVELTESIQKGVKYVSQ